MIEERTDAPRSHDFDPLDAEAQRDPQAVYADLRARCPVAHSEQFGGFWALTKYADIMRAARETETFISAPGTVIPRNPRPQFPAIPLQADPPEHTIYRNLLRPYFSATRMAVLEPQIRAMAEEMLAPVLAAGHGDIARDLTFPLPARVLLAFLNMPQDDWSRIKEWTAARQQARRAGDTELANTATDALLAYINAQIDVRRTQSFDLEHDLVCGLVAAEQAGVLTDDQVRGCCSLLLNAGHETTSSGLANSILFLAEHAETQAQLRATPELLGSAIQEFLRYDSPVQALARHAAADVEIRGRHLTAGDPVALVWSSGNRDEEAFPSADQCILDRKPNRHIAFGYGIHRCIGADLAALEMKVVLEVLLARTRHFELDGPVVRTSWATRGVTSLPLAFHF
jgi:cytochrome P450